MLGRTITELENWRLSLLLLACIILGGTSQYIYAYKLPLYIISLLMIGLILSSKNRFKISQLRKVPTFLLLFLIALFIIYSIPLSSELWTSFKGRELVSDGYTLLTEPHPRLPISLHPEKTLFSLFDFLPIIAVGMITLLSLNERELYLAKISILIIVIVSCFLGILQLIDGSDLLSLYDTFNKSRPIGFFSNTNHFSCLMVMSIPLALFFLMERKSNKSSENYQTFIKFISGMSITLAVSGVLLSGSSAGYFMLLFCIPACLLTLHLQSAATKISIIIAISTLLVLLIDFFLLSGEIWSFLNKFSNENNTDRSVIFETSLNFRQDFGKLGIGPGAFEDIYKIYEGQSSISNLYVNNVHNDYIQLWLELGIFGAISIFGFLFWYLSGFIKSLFIHQHKSKTSNVYFIILFFPLVHSLADYPLRTIAISSIFAFFVASICRQSADAI